MRGRFIVFEGLDGCGTTTQINLLEEYLKKRGIKVLITKEPTNNIIGGLIRGNLTKGWRATPECLQLLFAADRAYHLEYEIKPALKKRGVVLCDRYVLSSLAYGGLSIDIDWLKEINKNFLIPDLVIFIDASPKECIKRLKKTRFSLELFEEGSKLEKVRENYYQTIKKYDRVKRINGDNPISDVFRDIKREIDKVL